MKNTVLIIYLLILTINGKAQNKNHIYLAGGFGGTFISMSSFNGETAYSIGGGGAMLFNNAFYIGGFGQGSSDISKITSNIEGYKNYVIQTEFGGVWLGYILRPSKRWDFDLSTQVAWGEVSLDNIDQRQKYYDKVFVIIPGFSINYRLTYMMKLQIFINYTAFNKVNLIKYSNKDFSGLSYGIRVMFGVF
ncbi:MAG: hypothetical protein L3J74_04535 [Bacteroidales bacterium]|nr:hypothetical protein [Bacteroidales bacterium]